MSLFRAVFLLVAGSALAATANAGVFYKYYDKSGNLVITDTPSEGAEKVETKPVMTIPFPKGKQAAPESDQKKGAKAAAEYTIVIQSPAAESTYQRNGDPIPVAVSVSPALAQGHRLEMLLDGKSVGDASTTSIPAATLERGAHQFQVRVVDGKDKVLKEVSAAFFIQQPSALAPKPKTGP